METNREMQGRRRHWRVSEDGRMDGEGEEGAGCGGGRTEARQPGPSCPPPPHMRLGCPGSGPGQRAELEPLSQVGCLRDPSNWCPPPTLHMGLVFVLVISASWIWETSHWYKRTWSREPGSRPGSAESPGEVPSVSGPQFLHLKTEALVGLP